MFFLHDIYRNKYNGILSLRKDRSMFKSLLGLTMTALFISQPLYATSAEEYINACTANQGNRMDREHCECMANEGKDLSDEEFEFFYAIAAKDQEKVNKGHMSLDANQKMNVMQLSMMGPTKCANKLAEQEPEAETQNSSANASSAETVSESAADSASQ